MKKIIPVLLLSLAAACSSKKELTKDEAYAVIKKEKQFPKPVDFETYRSDPSYATRILNTDLEEQGLVIVHRTQKLGEAGKPLIDFTDKAKQYLIPFSTADRNSDVQKVKVADQDLIDIKNVQVGEDGRQATVEYSTGYRNLSSFSALMPGIKTEPVSHKAVLILQDDGWKLKNE